MQATAELEKEEAEEEAKWQAESQLEMSKIEHEAREEDEAELKEYKKQTQELEHQSNGDAVVMAEASNFLSEKIKPS